jgi:hypothetical protein
MVLFTKFKLDHFLGAGQDVDMFERQHVRDELLKYCWLDTMAMVWIVEKLKEIAL